MSTLTVPLYTIKFVNNKFKVAKVKKQSPFNSRTLSNSSLYCSIFSREPSRLFFLYVYYKNHKLDLSKLLIQLEKQHNKNSGQNVNFIDESKHWLYTTIEKLDTRIKYTEKSIEEKILLLILFTKIKQCSDTDKIYKIENLNIENYFSFIKNNKVQLLSLFFGQTLELNLNFRHSTAILKDALKNNPSYWNKSNEITIDYNYILNNVIKYDDELDMHYYCNDAFTDLHKKILLKVAENLREVQIEVLSKFAQIANMYLLRENPTENMLLFNSFSVSFDYDILEGSILTKPMKLLKLNKHASPKLNNPLHLLNYNLFFDDLEDQTVALIDNVITICEYGFYSPSKKELLVMFTRTLSLMVNNKILNSKIYTGINYNFNNYTRNPVRHYLTTSNNEELGINVIPKSYYGHKTIKFNNKYYSVNAEPFDENRASRLSMPTKGIIPANKKKNTYFAESGARVSFDLYKPIEHPPIPTLLCDQHSYKLLNNLVYLEIDGKLVFKKVNTSLTFDDYNFFIHLLDYVFSLYHDIEYKINIYNSSSTMNKVKFPIKVGFKLRKETEKRLNAINRTLFQQIKHQLKTVIKNVNDKLPNEKMAFSSLEKIKQVLNNTMYLASNIINTYNYELQKYVYKKYLYDYFKTTLKKQ